MALRVTNFTFLRHLLNGCSERILSPRYEVHQLVMQRWQNFCCLSPTPKQTYLYFDKKRPLSTLLSNMTKKEKPEKLSKAEEEDIATRELENLSPTEVKKLKVLQLEHDIWLTTGRRIPEKMSNVMWLTILRDHQTPSSRDRIYKFWFKREILREKDAKLKAEKRALRLAREAEKDVSGDQTYHNRILQRVPFKVYPENNLAFSMIHGPHLVFDMSYDQMSRKEVVNLMDQFQDCHGANKFDSEPFHFHFCNVRSSFIKDAFNRNYASLESLLYTTTELSYMDCYDPKSLVYLSPNSPHILDKFSYDDVYIIGGIVDKVQRPVSFANAKRNKIRSARLPLDKYLKWDLGSKALTLDQMVKIMLTIKKTDDWLQAFKHVPKRKHSKY